MKHARKKNQSELEAMATAAIGPLQAFERPMKHATSRARMVTANGAHHGTWPRLRR